MRNMLMISFCSFFLFSLCFLVKRLALPAYVLMPLNRRQIIAAGIASLAATTLPPVRLVLLGVAGGPSPKPNRAAPASAIIVNHDIYLVDCGNGVARQIAMAGLELTRLKAIFLTHHHSDHNLDYGAVQLLRWASGGTTPVESFGPPPLITMARDFLALNRVDIETRQADEGRPAFAPLLHPHEVTAAGPVYADAGVHVRCALAKHPPLYPAFAYRFDAPGRSIVFSGDTAPSAAVAELAQGADILVHEVMYGPAVDAIAGHDPSAARLKAHLLAAHTLVEDAARLAQRAGVKTLVMNHFVPGGLPGVTDAQWLAAARPYFSGEIIVGRDLMVI
jgi:ribonuclease BN (tRNA processing enzyme)